jgi:hypothetical protein
MKEDALVQSSSPLREHDLQERLGGGVAPKEVLETT